jgi:tetratricopeptide (TPR) repeat protein
MRNLVIFTLSALCLCLSSMPARSAGLNNCQDYLEMKMYGEAINCAEAIARKEPKNAEAHLFLGNAYLAAGNRYLAFQSYERALIADAKMIRRIDQRVWYADVGKTDEILALFEKTLARNSGAKDLVLASALELGDRCIAQGSLNNARKVGDFVIRHDPAYKKKIYAKYLGLGEGASLENALVYLDLAMSYAEASQSREVGKSYLYLAAKTKSSRTRELAKERAAQIFGQAKVDEIIPGEQEITFYEKTYTFDDAFDKTYGQVYAFRYNEVNLRSGDILYLEATPLIGGTFDGFEIAMYMGQFMNPKWKFTVNGKLNYVFDITPYAEYFMFSFCERKDLKATIKIKRRGTPAPDISKIDLL